MKSHSFQVLDQQKVQEVEVLPQINMQPTTALRDAIVATIVLSPAFINGLSLPWNYKNALAARAPVLSGDIDHASINEVRTNADAAVNSHNNQERASSHDDDDDSDSEAEFDFPTATGKPGSFPTGFGGGGAPGFPTGGFGGGGKPQSFPYQVYIVGHKN